MGLGLGFSSYCISVICERDPELVHGCDHGLHRLKYIVEDGLGEGPSVFLRIAFSMDDPHLLNEGAFSTLACT